jgi:DNA polymerase I-like protein with 3'-5' exonuclease and polymerase domains
VGITQAVPGIDLQKVDGEYFTIRNAAQLSAFVDMLINAGCSKFAVDCEWGGTSVRTGGRLRTIQLSWESGYAAVIVLRDENGTWVFNGTGESTELLCVSHELKRLFERPDVKLIGHYARADAPWLEDVGIPFMKHLWFDTLLADHLLNESADHALEGLSVRYTTLGRYDFPLRNWIKSHPGIVTKTSGYMGIPEEILIPYAAKDADCTFRSHEVLLKMLRRPDNRKIYDLFFDIVMPANQPIFEMEQSGLLIDADRMVQMLWRYVEKKQEILGDLRSSLHDWSFNPRSYKQKVQLLFGSPSEGGLGLTPIKTTGKPSMEWSRVMALPERERVRKSPAVDSEVLELLAADAPDKVRPIVEQLNSFQIIDQMTKNFLRPPPGMDEIPEDMSYDPNMYIEGLLGHIGADGRIHTRISQTKETGRYGSSGPNLQNWSKRQESRYKDIVGDDVSSLRSCVVAPDGYVLIESDYKSAEVVGLAYISGDKVLLEDALGPIKLHAKVAVDIFHAPCSYQEVSKAFPHLYVAAKNINFGIPYQRGAKAIARQINRETKGNANMDAEQAQRIIDAWYERYSGVRAYVDWCKRCVRTNPHWIENPYGRRRRFYPTSDESVMAAQEREAVNFPIQSVVADTLSTALYNLWVYRQKNPWCAYRILLAIHDAAMLEVPIEHIEHVMEFVLPNCMVHDAVVPQLNFSFDIDPEVTLRWGEAPDKKELERRGVPEKYR